MTTIENLKLLVQVYHDASKVPVIWGDAGVGKTAFIRELCKEKGADLLYIDVTKLFSFSEILAALPGEASDDSAEIGADTANTWIFFDNLTFAQPKRQLSVQIFLDKYADPFRRKQMGVPDSTKVIVAGVPFKEGSSELYRPSAKLQNLVSHFTMPAASEP